MLLYFFYSKRSKYALEALHLHAALTGSLSLCLREELLWSRVINTRGGAGTNIPSDLYMEHLNRTLKDYLRGLGAKCIRQYYPSGRQISPWSYEFDRAL